MPEDKVLARDYTGGKVGYVAEIYVYGKNGDRISVAPLTARQAIDLGLDLITRALRVLR